MNTLIIITALFSVQPGNLQLDTQSFDLQNMREQILAYLVEDIETVNNVIYSSLKEGIGVGSKLLDQASDTATLLARKETAAATEQPLYQVN